MLGSPENHSRKTAVIEIVNTRYTISSHEVLNDGLRVSDGKIISLATADALGGAELQIDLKGFLVLPGFVNAHDHLQYALHPRIGNGPYSDYVEWGKDIHENLQPLISRYNAVPKHVRLWWGGLRNLLCGVTTVCHHDPLWPALHENEFPIKVLRNYGWAHSVQLDRSAYQNWKATPKDQSFVIHACEGTNERSQLELDELEELGMLDERTVLVHGLALDCSGFALLRRRSSSLVLCLSSNKFLYDCIPKMCCLDVVRSVAIGNDSPLTAIGDLLDEVRFAIDHAGVPTRKAYPWITENPAAMLRLSHDEGHLSESASADLIAIRDNGEAPHERLRTLSWRDIEFVMIAGQVQLASERVWDGLPELFKSGLEAIWVDGEKRWLRAPIKQIYRAAEDILGADGVRLNGRVVRIDPSLETASSKLEAISSSKSGRV